MIPFRNVLDAHAQHFVVKDELLISILTAFAQYTRTLLRSGRSGDRIPLGARFFAPLYRHWAHQSSCIMGTSSFFRGVKRPERGVIHSHLFIAEVKERVELYLFSSGPLLPCPRRTLPLSYTRTLNATQNA